MIRMHPAVAAQAAATTAEMFDGRFFFGVGTGENLNEHITGERWPEFEVRMAMLEEAVDVMRKLWTGDNVSHHGEHYTVENAKLFTLPDEPPEVYVSGTGPKSARKAGEFGDGLVSTAPVADLVDRFQEAGDGPRYGQATVCYAEDEDEAVERPWSTGPTPPSPGTSAGSCRRRSTSRRWRRTSRRPTSRRASSAAPTSTTTSSRSRRSPTRGSTTCTSTRSARTRRASSSSTSRKCCRPSAEAAAGTTSSPERERGRCRRASIPT